MVTLLVLFDFSKAFDTVDHSLLLSKLSRFDLSEQVLSWFRSYLLGRSQAVIGPDGSCSSWLPVVAGVPQGSVLGPLLFSLFINDLSTVLSHSKHILYADDLQIYLHCFPSDIDAGMARVARDVGAVHDWAAQNRLRLNLAKTKAICLASGQFTRRLDLAERCIGVGDAVIRFDDSVRTLGMQLSSNLSWTSHINSVCARVNRGLYQLRLHQDLFSLQLRRRLVTALLFAHFDYCSLVYCDLTREQNLRLQRAFNSCVRFVHRPRWDAHITPLRLREGWLSLEHRRSVHMACLYRSILLSRIPSYLYELVTFPLPDLRTTRVTNLRVVVPRCRTEIYRRSFTVMSAYLWNSLSDSLVEIDTPYTFKCAVRRLFLMRESDSRH